VNQISQLVIADSNIIIYQRPYRSVPIFDTISSRILVLTNVVYIAVHNLPATWEGF